MMEIEGNTSGQGSAAVIPKEIRGWNWGAFLLTWIWGIGNKVWIALLALAPMLFGIFVTATVPWIWVIDLFVGIVMPIVLGIKGNEWAWQYKRWDNIEHFKRTQRIWLIWGIVVGIIGLAFLILLFIAMSISGEWL